MAGNQDFDDELEDGPKIDFLALLQVLVKRKLLMVKICLLAAIGSAAYSMTLPNVYSATVKVLPPQKEGGALPSALGQLGGLAGLAAGAKGGDNDLYLSIVKSRSVGDAVIQRLDLGKVYHSSALNQVRGRLDGAVKVQSGKDGIIAITVEDTDPKLTALLANTMAEELGRTLVRLNLSRVGAERMFLEKRLDIVRKDLKNAEDDLKAFAQRNKIAQVDSQASAAVSGIAHLKAEIAGKEVEYAVLRAAQTDESYEVKALQSAINRLKQEVARLSGTAGDGEGVPILGKVPGLGLEYTRKMRELKTQEAIFEQLTKQYEMTKLSQAKDSSTMQILDEALVPEHKSRPQRSKLVIQATLIAFLASALLAFGLEYLEKMSEEDKTTLLALKRQALSFK